jgi:ABC-type phosphate transport system substrate-binding protein
MRRISKYILFVLLVFIQYSSYAQISVIVNKNIRIKSLSKEKIIDIYSLNTQNWDDGTKISIFDYKGENDVKSRFFDYLGISFAKMQKIWLRKQFSGAGLPPQTFRDFKEIVAKVGSTPGAIAYVPSGSVTKDVLVVITIEN